jgi:hypothetical protein
MTGATRKYQKQWESYARIAVGYFQRRPRVGQHAWSCRRLTGNCQAVSGASRALFERAIDVQGRRHRKEQGDASPRRMR